MSAREALLAEARKRVLVFDGAFGTEIQARRLGEADFAGRLGLDAEQFGNNDILALTRPDVIADVTRAYLEAGSDIVSTNTFSANRISQSDYRAAHLVADLNRAAADHRAQLLVRRRAAAAPPSAARRRRRYAAAGLSQCGVAQRAR